MTLRASKKALVLLTVLTVGLAGCAREVVLQGERLDVRAPLAQMGPLDAASVDQQVTATGTAAATNTAQPIAIPAAVVNADWTHRGGSATHMGVNGQLSANPQRIWSVDIGVANRRSSRVSGAPVVASGRVFALDAVSTLSAVSTAGSLLWQVDLRAGYDAGSDVSGGGIATVGDRVFASTGYGELVALDAATGGILWRQRLDAPVTGAPSSDGKAVYVVSRDGSASAVDAQTGKLIWQVQGVRAAAGVIGGSSPSVGQTEVYFPFASGEIAVISKLGGERTWGAAVAGQRVGRAYAVIGDLTGDPVLQGGVLYVGSASGRTVAIDAATGRRIWTATEGALNPPLVVGGSVFIVNDEARLVRLNAADGKVIWSIEMPYFDQSVAKKRKAITANYGPLLAGGLIAVASSDGQLRLFNPQDGALVGGSAIPGGAAALPALAEGLMFITGANGQLHAFR